MTVYEMLIDGKTKDKMSINRMTVDEMLVDDMMVNEISGNLNYCRQDVFRYIDCI
jgi:hypothetical protein